MRREQIEEQRATRIWDCICLAPPRFCPLGKPWMLLRTPGCPAEPRVHALQDFYSLTLDSMAEAKNERLWFKTNMKLANLLVGMKEGAKAAKVGLA
jgi:hypothetical protein